MVPGLATGDVSLVRERVTARQVGAFLSAPDAGHADGLGSPREQLEAPAPPRAVRAQGREVLERLSAWATTDPERAGAHEYLLSLPWT